MSLNQRFLNRLLYSPQQIIIDMLMTLAYALVLQWTVPLFVAHLIFTHIGASFVMAVLGYGDDRI